MLQFVIGENKVDEFLEQKSRERRMVEILVEKELINLSQESATKALETFNTGKFEVPDTESYARKIIAIVKEHSL